MTLVNFGERAFVAQVAPLVTSTDMMAPCAS